VEAQVKRIRRCGTLGLAAALATAAPLSTTATTAALGATTAAATARTPTATTAAAGPRTAPATARPPSTTTTPSAPTAPELAVTTPFHAGPLLVSGTDAYRHGEYLYQDYLLDDHGADTVAGLGSSAQWASQPLFSPAAGDVLYPTDRPFQGEAADLVEFRIRPTRRAVVYRVTFAVQSPAATVVAGIGMGNLHPNGPPVPWPFGAGITSPALDWFITAWGNGGAVTQFATHRTTRLPAGSVRWNRARPQMTIRVPRRLMNPRRWTWRYVAGTGLWGGHRWMRVVPGSQSQPRRPVSGNPKATAPSVFNLAFRFHEPVLSSQQAPGSGYTTAPGVGNWFEDGQARNLASHTSGDDYATVNFAALARGVRRFVHRPGRVQARIYGSRQFSGGANHAAFPEFAAALQPYLVRVPPSYRPGRPLPLLFSLHPSNSGYTVFNVSIPKWGPELGDARGSLVVTPLSRGLDGPDPVSGAFTGAAEKDFFDVWRDLSRHFTIDRSRVSLSGYSLGGYDAYALAETWPGRFANVFSVVGAPPSNGMNTNLLGNLRWEPVMAWNQADDSEVPYPGARAADQGLTALGLRHQAWTFPAGGHLAPALRDDWRQAVPWLDATRVVSDPPRIDYGYYPALDAHRYGLVHDHAYWLSHILLAPHRARGEVSAHSLAFGAGDPPASEYSRTGRSGGEAAVVHGIRWGPAPRIARRNMLLLTLRGIRNIRVNGSDAHLRPRGLRVQVSTDGPVTVRIQLGGICGDGKSRQAWLIRAAPGRNTFRAATCRPR
jgi:poly(3-hydroxybutyrate) depolymerase